MGRYRTLATVMMMLVVAQPACDRASERQMWEHVGNGAYARPGAAPVRCAALLRQLDQYVHERKLPPLRVQVHTTHRSVRTLMHEADYRVESGTTEYYVVLDRRMILSRAESALTVFEIPPDLLDGKGC